MWKSSPVAWFAVFMAIAWIVLATWFITK